MIGAGVGRHPLLRGDVVEERRAGPLLLVVGDRRERRVQVLLRPGHGDVQQARLVLDRSPVPGRVVDRIVRDDVAEVDAAHDSSRGSGSCAAPAGTPPATAAPSPGARSRCVTASGVA